MTCAAALTCQHGTNDSRGHRVNWTGGSSVQIPKLIKSEISEKHTFCHVIFFPVCVLCVEGLRGPNNHYDDYVFLIYGL